MADNLSEEDLKELLDLLEPFLLRAKELGMSAERVKAFVESVELDPEG